jgi:ribA/ribD-fused uncharacterized protein
MSKSSQFFEYEEPKMFDEVPVVGKTYKFGDWQLYAVHDEQQILGFFGDYRWLSNFHECPVFFEGMKFPSSENAYQAAKVDQDYRHHFQTCSPRESKNLWKTFPRIDISEKDWFVRKYDVMSVIVFDKMYRNLHLRKQLLETGDKFLEERNHWGDTCWGFDVKKKEGTNWLGRILMSTRDFWKEKP